MTDRLIYDSTCGRLRKGLSNSELSTLVKSKIYRNSTQQLINLIISSLFYIIMSSLDHVITVGKHSLYISNYPSARDKQLLKLANIKTICSVGLEFLEYAHTPLYKDIAHHVAPIDDIPNAPLIAYLQPLLTIIDAKLTTGSVLIHCAMGISRSASVVIAYLMRLMEGTGQERYDKARQFLKARRPVINPNSGFESQLIQWGEMTW